MRDLLSNGKHEALPLACAELLLWRQVYLGCNYDQLMAQLIDDIRTLGKLSRSSLALQDIDLSALADDALYELRLTSTAVDFESSVEEGLLAATLLSLAVATPALAQRSRRPNSRRPRFELEMVRG
mgnify:CR=1 FL=1